MAGGGLSICFVGPPAGTVGRFDSKEGLDLIQRWAWGEISAAHVQKKAALAYSDQCRLLKSKGLSPDHASTTLKVLSSIGTNGKTLTIVSVIWTNGSAIQMLPAPHGTVLKYITILLAR